MRADDEPMNDTRTEASEGPAGALLHLALQLGPLRLPEEAARVALEACAALAGAEAGLMLSEDVPPVALGVEVPAPAEARAILASAALPGSSGDIPTGLPGPARLAVAIPAAGGEAGLLLLAGPTPFQTETRMLLAEAAPLVGQALDRARHLARARMSEVAREALVSRLAHDIRSPLVATQASLEVAQRLLRGQPVTPAIFDALRTGLRSVQLAVELCDDMLEISRLQQSNGLARRQVPLRRLVGETCEMLRYLADQRGVLLEEHQPAAELRAFGDERLLRRMLTNLVTNSLRFAPAGGKVALEGLPGDVEGTVLLRVSDTGPGIPLAERERIFEPFAQGPGEASRGTGLGLALCREVAIAHGGSIWAEERPGGGARFVVRLPAAP
ncbi:MAG: hypothetical protein OHK0015_52160 [Chloroflexi bacterium OHK40]